MATAESWTEPKGFRPTHCSAMPRLLHPRTRAAAAIARRRGSESIGGAARTELNVRDAEKGDAVRRLKRLPISNPFSP